MDANLRLRPASLATSGSPLVALRRDAPVMPLLHLLKKAARDLLNGDIFRICRAHWTRRSQRIRGGHFVQKFFEVREPGGEVVQLLAVEGQALWTTARCMPTA